MVSLTEPTLEMVFLLDAFLFASNLFLCCSVSSSSKGAKSRKVACRRGPSTLLVGGGSASRPYSSDPGTCLDHSSSSAKHKHWVADLAHLDSTEHLKGRQVF